mmetsp:Transcript_30552/g.37301  ORF Transcript_30552/g.37301 Transcript_30552/m.37301 type:complete len:225 (+) Transcript_30552:97-771(+)|eukprot:CAMPEP_0172499672 /NCGR_PEP_ID=MMETSP1066-20121228/129461_1 /TAXON_ID=671091 /ORGANISM="Coscinodiscus wailesii, Strain CCMP2513" /LENGTH=224 /DNA_ID=CAMNT_0013273547 /DNA_START=90 /DNA_END=764 /DNA_ORIENTATION=+
MAKLTPFALLLVLSSANAFSGMTMKASSPPSHEISRRVSFGKATAAVAGLTGAVVFPLNGEAVVDEETPRVVTRMGGLLEKYSDTTRGWSIFAPSGWNKFDGEVGAYDVKWQDLVDGRENIKVSSNPVKSTTTSISALGEVQEVGKKLASARQAKLVKADERLTDGILFYTFEFALDEGTHQLLSLSVNKGRIWSLDANTTEKRWEKRKEMYSNVIGSFIPKLA